jgi:UDP-galactopyranose mutase
LPHVHFIGRLATYKYYNMDQVVGQALTLFKKLSVPRGRTKPERTRVLVPARVFSNGNGAQVAAPG